MDLKTRFKAAAAEALLNSLVGFLQIFAATLAAELNKGIVAAPGGRPAPIPDNIPAEEPK